MGRAGCSRSPAQQPHYLQTIKSIDKGAAPGWWLSRGSNSIPGGGSGGISPAQSPLSPCPWSWRLKIPLGVVVVCVTWTLCVSWHEFPPGTLFSGLSLALGRAGFPDSRLGWVQESWLQGIGAGRAGVLGAFAAVFRAEFQPLEAWSFPSVFRSSDHGSAAISYPLSFRHCRWCGRRKCGEGRVFV